MTDKHLSNKYQSAIEPVSEQDRRYLQTLQFPNTYALMTHLQDDKLVEELLSSVNLSKTALQEPNGTVSGLPFKQLLDINIARHDSPVPYSMNVAEEFNVATHGMLGLAITASKDLGEALQLLLKFTPLINPALIVDFKQEQDYSYCFVDCHPSFGGACAVMVEIAMMVIMQFLSQSKEQVTPYKLDFSHQTPFAQHYYQDYFQCPVTFGCNAGCMVFANTDLRSPMQFYDQSTAAVLQQHLDSQLNRYQYQQYPWTAEARKFIQAHLESNPQQLSRDAMADYFNVTTRTLTRKLSHEHTSFQTLVEEIKCETAKEALANSRTAIADIAFDLGFNEPQAFSRAFRRWTGETARDYRERKTASTHPAVSVSKS